MATASQSPLPPGLSDGQFRTALRDFAAALGEEWVVSDPSALVEFFDPYNLPGRTDFKPSAALFPASVEEIQAILRIANRDRIPLWTVSQGKNNAYGGAAPRLPGAVLVNLRRMNKVLEIDETCAYAVVEPGVLGQRHRQHARSRRRLYALWRAYRVAMRHGDRAGEWRRDPHRHGRDDRQPHLADL